MSASKRAAAKIDHAYCAGEMDERPRERAEIAAIIDAEYAPLIKAAQAMRHIHLRGNAEDILAYDTLIAALAHIEGDAAP